MEFFATCPKGLEGVLGNELRTAGVQRVRPLVGGASIEGELVDAYRALLWSRVASHVLLTLSRVPSADADELYEGVRAIAWEEHIGVGRTIAVDARGVNAKLRNTQFSAVRVKDAICDRLMDLRGERPNVDTKNPDLLVNVQIRRDKATVSLDLSGKPLEQRGYRIHQSSAAPPLRENLAAGLLMLAGWDRVCADEDAVLLDPLCGDGTLAIEAALIAHGIAPGILRSNWGFSAWEAHDEELWAALLEDADARAQEGAEQMARVRVLAQTEETLSYARARAKRAGVAGLIEFELGALGERGTGHGAECALAACHVTASMGSQVQSPRFASMLVGDVQRAGARRLALAADAVLPAVPGLQAAEDIPAVNRGVDCALRVYDIPETGVAPSAMVTVRDTEVPVFDERAQQFASRLNKVAKQRRKWAAKNKINAYRVYDADLPDYNLAVDVYNGAGHDEGRRLVYVAEYAAPKEIDPEKTTKRLMDALAIIPVVLEANAADVFVKQRVRSKGGSQYASATAASSGTARAHSPGQGGFTTSEDGLLFEVNLADYLDTGLFLDHRDTRALVKALAKDKVFLNLFAYTGTASVYAAAGGAKYTTTVDLSNTYLNWAKRNMQLNGLLDEHQEFERADCIAWVQEKRRTKERWDLIFCDPPTYSNSSKMGTRTWDVQRDHAELLIGASRLLRRGGAIVFSCNLRSFKPDVGKITKTGIQMVDITPKTIPEDFQRHSKIHHCYLLRRV